MMTMIKLVVLLFGVASASTVFFQATGPESAMGDGALSVATCPPGFKPISCNCTPDERYCDGARFRNGNQCQAFCNRNCHFERKTIRASAMCYNPNIRDIVYSQTNGALPNPVMTCTNGTLVDCTLINFWGEYYTTRPALVKDGNSCRVSKPCTVAAGCIISIACSVTVPTSIDDPGVPVLSTLGRSDEILGLASRDPA